MKTEPLTDLYIFTFITFKFQPILTWLILILRPSPHYTEGNVQIPPAYSGRGFNALTFSFFFSSYPLLIILHCITSINVLGYSTKTFYTHITKIGQTLNYFTGYIIKTRNEPSLHFLVLEKAPFSIEIVKSPILHSSMSFCLFFNFYFLYKNKLKYKEQLDFLHSQINMFLSHCIALTWHRGVFSIWTVTFTNGKENI